MSEAPPTLHETALIEEHRALGAKLAEFAGWLMPIQYSGILEEHRAVRERVGLFDLSHMGELFIDGPGAGDALAAAVVSDPRTLAVGRAHYSMICDPDGGIIDDLIIYRVATDRYLVCANAGNSTTVSDALADRIGGVDAVVDDRSMATSLVAIQGPRALEVLQPLCDRPLDGLAYYAILEGRVAGVPAFVARTGYTGEDGFEIYVSPGDAPRLWEEILESGSAFGIKPCGLGARNTLRLEAGMALYGHEVHASISPWEANLGWIVKMDKDDFIGRDALKSQKARGVTRKLVGFEMIGRGIGRDGYEVCMDGVRAGWVASGGPSPTLNKNIGLCFLPSTHAEAGRYIQVMVRGQAVEAMTVPIPFYERSK